MGVKKLYYENSHLKTFEAVVTGCTQGADGWDITIDATAFYPEGGGQPCDTGTLGDCRVLSVREDGDEIFHTCDAPLAVGSRVTGTIDWRRRFDLMQQHSGEHMVSGVIHALYGYHNVGFHIGSDVVTIDFDGPLPAGALQTIEDRVNAAIWENTPVRCFYPSRQELETLPYRRKKDLPWPVRLVEFPGIDLCACCGTQVQQTGEVGLVKLFSCVKFHEGVRIEMACGKRAMDILNTAYDQNKQVSQMFSAKMQETSLAAKRISDTLSAEKFRSAELEKRLFSTIAQGYRGEELGLHFEKDLSPGANRELCSCLAEYCTVAVTLSGTDETGYSLCIVSHTQNAKALGDRAIAVLGGKGGGKTAAFQGNIPAKRAQIVAFFSRNISE